MKIFEFIFKLCQKLALKIIVFTIQEKAMEKTVQNLFKKAGCIYPTQPNRKIYNLKV